jgi:hypothetical protein
VAAGQKLRVEVCPVKDVERVQALQASVIVADEAVHLRATGSTAAQQQNGIDISS